MPDLKNSMLVAHSIDAGAKTADVNGTSADLLGYAGALVIFNFGVYTDGTTWIGKIQESADNSTFTDVAAGDQIGTFTAITGTTVDQTSQMCQYIGSKRYIRAMLDNTGTPSTGILAAATIIKLNPVVKPAA